MCGLIYGASFKNKPINRQIMDQFDKQKTRGRQGFGVFDGNYQHLIRKTKEEDILKWLNKYKSSEILFHHRFPTSTDNVKNACHPFSTKDHFKTNYILIHNGHIGNARMLKEDHNKLGIDYYSVQDDNRFNDSESLLWDVALYLEGKQEKLESYGGIAFICIALNGGRKKLHFARNMSNPLFMKVNKKGIFLASVFGDATQTVDPHTLYTFDFETKKLTKKSLRVKTYFADNGEVEKKETSPTPVVPRDKSTWTAQSYASKQADIKDESHTAPPEDYDSDPQYVYDDGIVYDDAYDIKHEASRKKNLLDTYAKYINENEGYYFIAIKQIRADIKDWDEMRWDARNQEDLQGIIETVSILRSIKDMMMIDPNFKKFNDTHPSFPKDKDQLKFLEAAV